MELGVAQVGKTDMREFDSFLGFSRFLVERIPRQVLAFHHALERIGKKVETTAKSEFGEYQPGIGSYPAWAELSDVTKDERVQQGFTANDPLYRSGELRDAVTHDVDTPNLEVAIGVKSGDLHSTYPGGGGSPPDLGELMIWHELGTQNMPPRPVLGPALMRNQKVIEEEVGAAILEGWISFPRRP